MTERHLVGVRGRHEVSDGDEKSELDHVWWLVGGEALEAAGETHS